ncbi:MAG: GTP cyclohydrolase II [Legionellales bacterium]|nr:GTP cyclohydrolase II [Legionellales bacterium]
MQTIKQAIEDIRLGKMVVVIDDELRENEGDLIIAAEKVTPAAINFMIKKGGGLICLAMQGVDLDNLSVGFMNPDRAPDDLSTPFTMSIDARYGITTGISAEERARTILTAVNPAASAADLVMPGHIFPLRGRDNGILERPGHTEASIDLARLAGLRPAGVICEIIGEDGSMLRGQALVDYAQFHGLSLISVRDLIVYREQHEPEALIPILAKIDRMQKTAAAPLKTDYGIFEIQVYRDRVTQLEHVALLMGDRETFTNPLIRIHSSCVTGDIFASQQCDCGKQLQFAMQKIAEEGQGLIIYLDQEGRGIGLTNKIRAYALQKEGHDTVSANLALGMPIDSRDYVIATDLLKQLGIKNVRLMTNNPTKLHTLSVLMEGKVERVPHQISEQGLSCHHYLKTKRDYLGHMLQESTSNQ